MCIRSVLSKPTDRPRTTGPPWDTTRAPAGRHVLYTVMRGAGPSLTKHLRTRPAESEAQEVGSRVRRPHPQPAKPRRSTARAPAAGEYAPWRPPFCSSAAATVGALQRCCNCRSVGDTKIVANLWVQNPTAEELGVFWSRVFEGHQQVAHCASLQAASGDQSQPSGI